MSQSEPRPPTICKCGMAKSYHDGRIRPATEYEPRYEPGAWKDGYRRGYKHGYEAAKKEDPRSALRGAGRAVQEPPTAADGHCSTCVCIPEEVQE